MTGEEPVNTFVRVAYLRENPMFRLNLPRLFAASIAAFSATMVSLTVLFGNPFVESILFSASGEQSQKMLDVWLVQEPLPAVTPFWSDLGAIDQNGLAVSGMLFVWSAAMALIFATAWIRLQVPLWKRGVLFGLSVWATLWLFFEAWIPYNLLGEPFSLVVLELGLELAAMLVMGLSVALVYKPKPDSSSREDVPAQLVA